MTGMLNTAPQWSHARGNAVVPSPWQATTVGEGPGSFDGRARPEVVGTNFFDEREDVLSTLDCEAGYGSQLIHGQLEVVWSIRHRSILADAVDPEADR